MKRKDEDRLSNLSPFEVKNILLELADSKHDRHLINAGRGNPNWVATVPREAFFKLGEFALHEAQRGFQKYDNFGGVAQIKGISQRFQDYFKDKKEFNGVKLLLEAVEYCQKELGIESDSLIDEWVDGILGDNYPVPDRMLKESEKIVRQYLMQEMNTEKRPLNDTFDIFAVEGGTAAMVYIFNSLKSNRLLNSGDTIAIAAPIFTPYIEMPGFEDYNLKTVEIVADEMTGWQIPDAELEKLKDPKIKAFFLVNPTNPPSVKLDDRTLNKIVEITKERPDLILLTDDVYGTFTDNFTSLAIMAPKNTILVYSFSKYFGATGWRLGAIAIAKDNIFDRLISKHNAETKKLLNKRYEGISLHPEEVTFINRMVADSRAVALNHTAGLSTPQQMQMVLFSLFSLSSFGKQYKIEAKEIVRERYAAVIEDSPVVPLVPLDNPHGAFYYIEIDVLRIAIKMYGEKFGKWLVDTHNPLDFVIRYAEEKKVIAMPGGGFDAPEWSFRLSLANNFKSEYREIHTYGMEILKEYYQEFKEQ
ncbi:bifunctional aspartate transaminase/aspartate 4-decarboxylase [bacterium]|nr:bifunctional aspartate transaminase/aspartate 4-decarboxylase [bacterium]